MINSYTYLLHLSSEECPGFLERTSLSGRCIPCRIQHRRTVDRNNFRRKQAKLKAMQKKVEKVRPLKEKLKRMKAKVCKLVFVILHNISASKGLKLKVHKENGTILLGYMNVYW